MRLLLLAWFLMAWASPVAAERRTVTVYTPHGRELMELCETRFEAANPEVDVRWLDMGSQEILDRLRAESARPRAQVWFGAPATMFMTAAEEGLLAPYSPSWAEAAASDRRDASWRWAGTFLTPQVLLFNTRRVEAEEAPTRFLDLLDERFHGRVILREPLASGTMRTIFGALVMAAPNETEGLRRLAQLDRAVAQYAPNPTLMFQSLARGRGEVTLWNLPDAMLQIERYGFPFDYRVPRDGTPVLVDGIALVDGAVDDPDARAFYEFVTSEELAVAMAHEFFRIPVRSDLDPTRLPEWMRQDIPALEMDWTRLAEQGPAWMNTFDRRIKGRGDAFLAESKAP